MLKSREGKKLNADHNSKAKKKVIKEAPTGYIHVRARRGQATDSHSLAERVFPQFTLWSFNFLLKPLNDELAYDVP